MIVTPHSRFPAGNGAPGRDVVPPLGTVIDTVKQETFVLRCLAQVRNVQQSRRYRKAGSEVTFVLEERTYGGEVPGLRSPRLSCLSVRNH